MVDDKHGSVGFGFDTITYTFNSQQIPLSLVYLSARQSVCMFACLQHSVCAGFTQPSNQGRWQIFFSSFDQYPRFNNFPNIWEAIYRLGIGMNFDEVFLAAKISLNVLF